MQHISRANSSEDNKQKTIRIRIWFNLSAQSTPTSTVTTEFNIDTHMRSLIQTN